MSSSSTSGEKPRATRTQKGERTRRHILEAALTLFRERGYDDTTMREIARRAGVSLGNAYYYFRSKEHLIQSFYARTHTEHLAACESLLESEKNFRQRLKGVLDAKIDTSEPYHRFAGILFKTAADPYSPLSPFSPESQPLRREATDLFRSVVEGSSLKPSKLLADELPNLLWLYQMAILLFWIHDHSTDCRRTYRLIDHTSLLVTRLIRLAKNPLLRPLTQTTLDLLKDLRAGSANGELTT